MNKTVESSCGVCQFLEVFRSAITAYKVHLFLEVVGAMGCLLLDDCTAGQFHG